MNQAKKGKENQAVNQISEALNILKEKHYEANNNKGGKAAANMIEAFVEKRPDLEMQVMLEVCKIITKLENYENDD